MKSVSARSSTVVDTKRGMSLLSFYNIPPGWEVNLNELDRVAQKRIRVLCDIDAAKVRGGPAALNEQFFRQRVERKLELRHDEDVREDMLSHFAMRIAYCRPADRRWFLNNEVDLLRLRLKFGGYTTVRQFLAEQGMHYDACNDVEADRVRDSVSLACNRGKSVGRQRILKVPFQEALQLVSTRRAYLENGIAFVLESEAIPIVMGRYRAHLSESLARGFRHFGKLQTRFSHLQPMWHQLQTQAMANAYKPNANSGKMTLDQLDAAGARSFAPCMSHLKAALEEHHKLRHFGRLQYGLFLKGIGVSLDDSLVYWRQEFLKVMSEKDFNSGYAYNIKHNYGQVGKRTDYSPLGCDKIIRMAPGTGEHHGCPFRHFGEEQLRGSLKADFERRKVTNASAAAEELVKLAADHHYQIACKRHWELLRPDAPDDLGFSDTTSLAILHPNQYFDASEAFYKQKHAMEEDQGKTKA